MSVQNRHRLWSSQKRSPLPVKCNTVPLKCNSMVWAIRVMPGVMTVTERHLQGNNFLDGLLHTHTTAKLPNFLCLICFAFAAYVLTAVYCSSMNQ